jgi:hypothetical protein
LLGTTSASAANLSNVHSIGVVSAIGDVFHVDKVAVMVFGNKSSSFPIDDWGIDAAVVDDVKANLADGFTAVPITYDPHTYFGKDAGDIMRALKADPQAANVDAFLIATNITFEAPPPSSQHFTGLGLWRFPGPEKRRNHLCTYYRLSLYDAKTGRRIDTHWVADKRSDWDLASRTLDPALAADTAEELTDDQKAALKTLLRSYLGETVPNTVAALHLAAPMPQP